MSGSGQMGFGTTDPQVAFDIRADKFQFQKQGKRQGVLINEEGNLESYNSETDAAATGSEFILSYSRGGTGAITSEILTAIMGVSAEEIAAAGGATAFFNTLNFQTQDKVLFTLESGAIKGLDLSAVGDVLGSIRWVAASGSKDGFDKRSAGEAARIETVVNTSTSEGITSDMIFKLAVDPTNAPVQMLRLDGGGAHELTGSLNILNGLVVAKDTNTSAEIGRAHIGYIGHSDYAGFSHIDKNGTGTYALLQSAAGGTLLNAAPGQNIHFRINNSTVGQFDSTGKFHAENGMKVTGDFEVTGAITSSILSSSIIYSSGSNIFGDALVDTHLFNGHITASGNISSSGVLTVNTIIGSINGGSF
jgi:hypothetical protein